VVQQGNRLVVDCHPVPTEIDEQVARLKLKAAGVSIDTLTQEQQNYLANWQV
jgi:adenosylhomocysteinase